MLKKISLSLLFTIIGIAIFLSLTVFAPLQSISVQGLEREYRLFVPSHYDPKKATSLVFSFHGSGSNPSLNAVLTDFESIAESENFILVMPKGIYLKPDDAKQELTWNSDNVTIDASGNKPLNDIAFIGQLVGHLQQEYNIDNQRIYTTGMSEGARISAKLACSLPGTFAAIGMVAGLRFPEECQSLAVPVVSFHGEQDDVNLYDLEDPAPKPFWHKGAKQAVADWVVHNQCSLIPTEQSINLEVTRLSYQSCQNNASVVFYRSDTAGHTWPGFKFDWVIRPVLGKTDTIAASQIIWDFFSAHPKP